MPGGFSSPIGVPLCQPSHEPYAGISPESGEKERIFLLYSLQRTIGIHRNNVVFLWGFTPNPKYFFPSGQKSIQKTPPLTIKC